MKDNHDDKNIFEQQGPFNRAWYNEKHAHSQVNGHTELSTGQIILKNDVVKKQKR